MTYEMVLIPFLILFPIIIADGILFIVIILELIFSLRIVKQMLDDNEIDSKKVIKLPIYGLIISIFNLFLYVILMTFAIVFGLLITIVYLIYVI